MAKYRIMYWKHIPQSFTVEGDGRTIKKQLSAKNSKQDRRLRNGGGINLHDRIMQSNTNAENGSNATALPKKLQKRFFRNWKLSSPKLKFPSGTMRNGT